ncbi:MAG TPA: SDR family oxidoreductase [Acidimicrobiales bacterium]|nr:SDR family oxidoreductase [Acidimicrobiales bacterium]
MRDDLRDWVVAVTGAGSGIGLATVAALQQRGARVAALDLSPQEAGRCGAFAIVADVTNQASLDVAAAEVAQRWGGIDGLVNNAGIGAVGMVEDNAEDEWRMVFDVNVLGIVRASRACLPYLRRSHRASIVNVSSIAASAGLARRALYSSSKGAVSALTRAMAADLLQDGVRVNCVEPGTVETPWVGRLLAGASAPERQALVARQPMGRLGLASEIAESITFLVGAGSSFVTGTSLAVDGGMAGLRVVMRSQSAEE